MVLQTILDVVWLLLPAGVANTVPVIAARYRWFPVLMRPLDGGATWRGRRILGDNKTVQGLLVGVIFGSITAYIEYLLGYLDSALFAIVFGAALGFGALAGDAVKSFVKRQLNIAPGKPWRPWDQIDFAIGALIVASLFIPLSFAHIVIALLIGGLLSIMVSAIGVALKIKHTV